MSVTDALHQFHHLLENSAAFIISTQAENAKTVSWDMMNVKCLTEVHLIFHSTEHHLTWWLGVHWWEVNKEPLLKHMAGFYWLLPDDQWPCMCYCCRIKYYIFSCDHWGCCASVLLCEKVHTLCLVLFNLCAHIPSVMVHYKLTELFF